MAADAELAADVPALAVERDHPRARRDVDDAVDDGRGRGAEALRLHASAPALRRSARLSRSGAAQKPTWLPLRWSPCPMGGKTTSATALSRNTVASATEAS